MNTKAAVKKFAVTIIEHVEYEMEVDATDADAAEALAELLFLNDDEVRFTRLSVRERIVDAEELIPD